LNHEPASRRPSGTITLLFTDIEDSTVLLESLGEDYVPLLRDHHDLLAANFASHGGTLVDTDGDGTFFVFPIPAGAVAAAAGAQRAMAGHAWPRGSRVRVRMGIHTGSPVFVDGRYVGLDVHRAARIAAAAHGGQVVASGVTVGLVQDTEFEWRDLGRYRLKGLKHPERIHQLRSPGLTPSHPPLRAVRWTSALPEPPTRFVGRRDDVASVVELVEGSESGPVTIVGAGGIGKTRLAVKVGHVWDERHEEDGVAFTPLATASGLSEMLSSISSAVELPDIEGADRMEALLDHLQGSRMLLILDNLEHLPEAPVVVSRLFTHCERLRILTTSRAPLNVYGERLHPLRPLTVASERKSKAATSDAVALFVDRARAVVPGFALDDSNSDTIVEMCRRLDGMPLAIELAAARLATLSLAELGQRLTIRLLAGGPADVDERQRTLNATIDWSYRLLDDEGRRVFRWMSVFVGGATLDDTEAVIGLETSDVFSTLAALVAHSLVWRDEEGGKISRYRMLETVREFASEALRVSGEVEEVERRHAERCLEFMRVANEHVDTSDAEEWLMRIERETPNLTAALRATLEDPGASAGIGVLLANELGWFWYLRGDPADAMRWLELAWESAGEDHSDLRVRLVYYAGAMLERLGRLEDAVTRFEQALEMFRERGDEQRVARTLNSLGGLAVDLGDTEGAFAHLTGAEQILRRLGDDYGRAVSMVNLSDAARATGDFTGATEFAASGRGLFSAMSNEWGVAVATRHLAKVAYEQGNLTGARELLLEALAGSRRVGDRSAMARCLERLGGIEIGLGSFRSGTRLAAAAQSLRRQIGAPLRQGRENFEAGWDEARRSLGDAEFKAAWDEGAAMTLDQIVDYALGPGSG
jgi:predicted ATPase/class 3 adenylate cyclase